MKKSKEQKLLSDKKEKTPVLVQTKTKPVAFADFQFNFFPLWLKRNGHSIKISPLSGMILNFLIENQHRPIFKDEIKAECWPVPPSPDAFNRALKVLRITLEDKRKDDKKKSWHFISQEYG